MEGKESQDLVPEQAFDRRRFLKGSAKSLAAIAAAPVIVSVFSRSAYANDPPVCGYYIGDGCVQFETDICGPLGKECRGPFYLPNGDKLTGRECTCV